MLKKTVILLILIMIIMTGCINKKSDEDIIDNKSKFDKMLEEVKVYKNSEKRAVTTIVQDGLYLKNGTILNFYSFTKLESLKFDEKVSLLEKIETAPTTTSIVVSNYTKTFYNYISLNDLLINGTNATTKIGPATTVYDVENSKYCFATGGTISTPSIKAGGTFTSAQTVTMSCNTSGVKIRYTLDGSEPITSSAEYISAITVSTTTTIKAKAFSSDGLIVSGMATAIYTINVPVTTTGFTYAGKTYYGKAEGGSGDPVIYESDKVIITEPKVSILDADGYFEIRGENKNTGTARYIMVSVIKKETSQVTMYFLEGKFNRKIWLRFGKGIYSVSVYPIYLTSPNTIVELGDGDIISYSYSPVPFYNYTINNTRDEDGSFTYPSNFIQSDEPAILIKANSILSAAGVTNGTIKAKARALHDYVIKNVSYDEASLYSGKRRKQDAITVLNTGLAVCEGYTSLYTALFRALGVPAKAVYGRANGGLHAWNNILAEDGIWYFVDTTWDDVEAIMPDLSIKQFVETTYFWLTGNTGINNDHILIDERANRNTNKINNYNKSGVIRNGEEGSY
jgi:hypothetical protein